MSSLDNPNFLKFQVPFILKMFLLEHKLFVIVIITGEIEKADTRKGVNTRYRTQKTRVFNEKVKFYIGLYHKVSFFPWSLKR